VSETGGQFAKQPNAPVIDVPIEGEWYNLKQVAGFIGVGYDRVRGFAESDGIKELLETKPAEGRRATLYSKDSVEIFRALVRAQDEGKVTPRTAAAFLRMAGGDTSNGAIAKQPNRTLAQQPNADAIPQMAGTALSPSEVMESIYYGSAVGAEKGTLRASERFLSIAEAHREFGVSIGALHKLSFLEGRRRKVRVTQVIEYMEQFGGESSLSVGQTG
jgi:hypothetical protein